MESNIFKILGIDSKENYHSKFLVGILNNDKVAKKCFIEMLQKVVGNNKIIHSDIDKYKIKIEKKLNENGRGDIFFSDHPTGKTRIIIENKIYAGDQPHQLYRYHKNYNVEDGYNPVLFYLTLDGKDATNFSKMRGSTSKCLVKNKDYFLLSYKDLILPWLKEIIEHCEKSLIMYINDYIIIIKELTWELEILTQMIKEDFDKNNEVHLKNSSKKITEYDFNAFLELKFWEYLEGKILNIKEISGLINRRLFNHEKIQNSQKNSFVEREYGIIFCLSNCEDQLFVQVNKDKILSISFGRISDDNKWIPKNEKPSHQFEKKTNVFKKEENMIKIANEIADQISYEIANLNTI